MKFAAFSLILATLLSGCASNQQPPTTTQPTVTTQSKSGVTPIGSNIGPMTPVAGGEDMDGGTAGAPAQIAKDRAKQAANNTGAESGAADATDR